MVFDGRNNFFRKWKRPDLFEEGDVSVLFEASSSSAAVTLTATAISLVTSTPDFSSGAPGLSQNKEQGTDFGTVFAQLSECVYQVLVLPIVYFHLQSLNWFCYKCITEIIKLSRNQPEKYFHY